jgi:hypothetical protein
MAMTLRTDEELELVMDVTAGATDVEEIAGRLRAAQR